MERFGSASFLTNVYDGLGRVGRQANANGSATLFFIAGSRTETVDPAGDRRVTYQTPRGRIVADAAVLSAGFGGVFNDTATQSGIVTVARNKYDGQDRLTLATAPARRRRAAPPPTPIRPTCSTTSCL
jgi:hypothetical protein